MTAVSPSHLSRHARRAHQHSLEGQQVGVEGAVTADKSGKVHGRPLDHAGEGQVVAGPLFRGLRVGMSVATIVPHL